MQSFFISVSVTVRFRKKLLLDVVRRISSAAVKPDGQPEETMKVLNVAEKNDAAKNIAALLSRGTSNRVTISPTQLCTLTSSVDNNQCCIISEGRHVKVQQNLRVQCASLEPELPDGHDICIGSLAWF